MSHEDDYTDILDIPLDSFLQCRGSVDPETYLDSKMYNKIKHIIATYDCFKDDVVYFSQTSQSSNHPNQKPYHNNNRQRNFKVGYHHKHRHEPSQPPRVFEKTPMKEVQGLLNKITENNYIDLVQKILRCCAYKECSVQVIQTILDKCYIHGSFSGLYHNLLQEMNNRYKEQTVTATCAFINDFIDTLPQALFDLEFQPSATHDYEGYCLYIKKKTQVIKKLENIIVIARHYLDSDIFFEDLYKIIISQVERVLRSKEKTFHDYIDLLSQIILMLKQGKAIPVKHLDELVFIYKDISDAYPLLPKKIHFCWEELLKEYNG